MSGTLAASAAVELQVELAFEGVVDRFGELADPLHIGPPNRLASRLRDGRSNVMPSVARSFLV